MSMSPLLNDALAALVLAAAHEAARLKGRGDPGATHWQRLADQGAAALRTVHDEATLRRAS